MGVFLSVFKYLLAFLAFRLCFVSLRFPWPVSPGLFGRGLAWLAWVFCPGFRLNRRGRRGNADSQSRQGLGETGRGSARLGGWVGGQWEAKKGH